MPAAIETLGEVQVLRQNADTILHVLKLNVEGITQNESLVQPAPAGNCLNWVVGHLLWVYNQILPLVNQPQLMPQENLRAYERGSQPIKSSSEALDLNFLLQALTDATDRVQEGLRTLTLEKLMEPAPFSPRKDPNESIGSLLAIAFFHQAYHVGQTAVLRRIIGKPGAIA